MLVRLLARAGFEQEKSKARAMLIREQIWVRFIRGCETKFFSNRVLPHKCGVPPTPGTPHLCGSEEFCRAPKRLFNIRNSDGLGTICDHSRQHRDVELDNA